MDDWLEEIEADRDSVIEGSRYHKHLSRLIREVKAQRTALAENRATAEEVERLREALTKCLSVCRDIPHGEYLTFEEGDEIRAVIAEAQAALNKGE